ncbi:hypothetical protein Salat_1890000 [Sesamum alatum]|uniref:Uncharacterized protein n=1 Tax=Sesamum alatum TaxID=300844 RepID=A0AAE1Y4D7_9LAMI|nr:hypothetical protein Salat_1890000 [Sesamum alatum]
MVRRQIVMGSRDGEILMEGEVPPIRNRGEIELPEETPVSQNQLVQQYAEIGEYSGNVGRSGGAGSQGCPTMGTNSGRTNEQSRPLDPPEDPRIESLRREPHELRRQLIPDAPSILERKPILSRDFVSSAA